MVKKFLSDGNVLVSLGLLFFVSSYALDRFATANPVFDFVRGLFVGLSIAALCVGIVVMLAKPKNNP
jgi:hypothetical protein